MGETDCTNLFVSENLKERRKGQPLGGGYFKILKFVPPC